MKDLIKILKIGTTTSEYPYFCQHINFTEDRIQTCSGSVFVEMHDNPFPILGCVNIHVLEGILNNCETPQITQNGGVLRIEDGPYKSDIMVDALEFPEQMKFKTDMIEITDEMLHVLKTAIKHTGEGILSYIFIDRETILSTQNKKQVFYHAHEIPMHTDQFIGINKKIMTVLSKGVEIGSFEGNTIVKFSGGTITFKIALLDNFPKEDCLTRFKEQLKLNKVCNIEKLQEAVKKVQSVLYGNKDKLVTLTNDNEILTIKAESISHGESTVKIKSDFDQMFSINMKVSYLSGIDADYDVFITMFDPHFLYLKNGESEIVLAGVVHI